MDPVTKTKDEETILDKLKSRKTWLTVIGLVLPIVMAVMSKSVTATEGLIASTIVVAMAIAGFSAEDISKHVRDGKIAQAKAQVEVAKHATIDLPKPQDPL